jgi:hypothetical protein
MEMIESAKPPRDSKGINSTAGLGKKLLGRLRKGGFIMPAFVLVSQEGSKTLKTVEANSGQKPSYKNTLCSKARGL